MTSQVLTTAKPVDPHQFTKAGLAEGGAKTAEDGVIGNPATDADIIASSREADILNYLGVDLQTLNCDRVQKSAKDVDDAIAAMLMLNMDLMAMLMALMDLCTKVINRTRRDNMAFEAQVTTAQCEKILGMFEKKLEAIELTCDAAKKSAIVNIGGSVVGMGVAVAGHPAIGQGVSSMSQGLGAYVTADDNMRAQQQHAAADMGLRMLTVCDQVARNIQDRLRALLDEMKKIIEAQTASVQKIAQSGVATR